MSREQIFSAASAPNAAGDSFAAVIDATGQSSVVVNHGALLLTADYVRSGPDLVLVGADGTKVLLMGFFASETPPTLLTLGGAEVSGHLASLLAGPAASGLAQASGSVGEAIGVVEDVEGIVFASRVDGSRVQLQSGDPVFQDDVIETSSDGAIGLRFVDDTTFSIADDARMVLDDFVYDPSANTGSAVVNVLQGSFSFVSGAVAQTGDDALTVKTPVLTIGIRGTYVTGRGGQEGETTEIVNLPDDNGDVGSIFASNSAGGVLLNDAYEGTQTNSQFTAPSQPRIYEQQEVQDKFDNALQFLPQSDGVGARDRGQRDDGDGGRDDGGAGTDSDGSEGDDEGEGTDDEGEGADDEGEEAEEEGDGEEEDLDAAEEGEGEGDGETAGTDSPPATADGTKLKVTGIDAAESAGKAKESEEKFEAAVKAAIDSAEGDDGSGDAGTGSDAEEEVAEEEEENNDDEIVAGSEENDEINGTDGDDTIEGGGGGDTINGGGGNDAISGGEGGDSLSGGAGNDNLDGGVGNDTLNGGQGNDTLNGGDGNDTADFSGTVGSISVDLTNNTVTDGFRDTDSISGVEVILGSAFADTFQGDGNANTFNGGAGNDTLNGGGGSDTLIGGAGDDLFVIGEGRAAGAIDAGVVPDGAAGATANPTAVNSAIVEDDVFLEGAFIAIGVSGSGSFGTANVAPAGFNVAPSVGNRLGMFVDQDGFGEGEAPNTADFFLPGAPEEGFTVGYRIGGATRNFTNAERSGVNQLTNQQALNQSSGDTLQAFYQGEASGAVGDVLQVDQTVLFTEDDKFFQTNITLTNTGSVALDSVRYMRSFDPDQESSGSVGGAGPTTVNTIINQPGDGGSDNLAIVSAAGRKSATNELGDPFFFLADDDRARVSTFGFSNRNAFEGVAFDNPQAEGTAIEADQAIAITFEVGTLDPGESASFTFFSSLDQNLEASVEAITGGDDTIIEAAGGGTDTVQSDIGFALPENVENLQLVGGGNIDGVGNADNNAITGTSGNNVLQGGDGNDSLNGASGNDNLQGGNGNDTLLGGIGVDTMAGGTGNDSFHFVSAADGVAVAANQTVAAAGVTVDQITDFQSGADQFLLDQDGGDFSTSALTVLGAAYDGTNSGLEAGEAVIFDGTHLIHDNDVNTAGYTVLAQVGGDAVAAADVRLISNEV